VPLIRTRSNATVNMACWASLEEPDEHLVHCSRGSRRPLPYRGARSYTSTIQSDPRPQKQRACHTFRPLQLQAIGMHRLLPLRISVKISDSEHAGPPRLPRADPDEQRGRNRIVSDEHGEAESVIQRQSVAWVIWQRRGPLVHRTWRNPHRTGRWRARHASPPPPNSDIRGACTRRTRSVQRWSQRGAAG